MGSLVEFRRFVVRLRSERERLGLSLSDVAERAEIDKAALAGWRMGNNSIRLSARSLAMPTRLA